MFAASLSRYNTIHTSEDTIFTGCTSRGRRLFKRVYLTPNSPNTAEDAFCNSEENVTFITKYNVLHWLNITLCELILIRETGAGCHFSQSTAHQLNIQPKPHMHSVKAKVLDLK